MYPRRKLLRPDEERAGEDDRGFEDREIARCIGFENERAETAPLEETLENDRATKKRSKLGADDGDDRTDRCGERVQPEDTCPSPTLRASDPEELGAKNLVERSTRDTRDVRRERKREATTR